MDDSKTLNLNVRKDFPILSKKILEKKILFILTLQLLLKNQIQLLMKQMISIKITILMLAGEFIHYLLNQHLDMRTLEKKFKNS